MGAGHHHVLRRAGLGLGDDVAGAVDTDARIHRDGRRGWLVAQPGAVGLGDAHRGDLDVGVLAQCAAADVVAVFVVGDDEGDGATLGRHGLLDAEGTSSTVDQHDGAGDVHAVVVRSPRSPAWAPVRAGTRRPLTPPFGVPIV